MRVGFLEGGDNIGHTSFRGAYRRILLQRVPPEFNLVFEPSGFKSAEWNQATCRHQASELAANKSLDIVVAIGPWAVEALQEARFDRPIIAVYRFQPLAEGLVDSVGRPTAANLSVVSGAPDLPTLFTAMRNSVPVAKLGLLVFPSGDELSKVTNLFSEVANRAGIEVVSAEGYNNVGTYAFFKSFKTLKRPIDALYVSPLWGFDGEKITQFMAAAQRAGLPVFTSEGAFVVERGALLSAGGQSFEQIARIAAAHTIRIMQGTVPNELPSIYDLVSGTVVNQGAADLLGIELPDDLLHGAHVIEAQVSPDADLLRLTDAVSLALARSPDLQAKQEAIESALAVAATARAARLPQISADASIGYIDDHAVDNSEGRFENMRFSGGVHLYQTLLSLGISRGNRVDDETVNVTRLQARQASRDLELAVALAFFDLAEARDRLSLFRAYRRTVDRLLESSHAWQLFDADKDIDLLRWQQERSLATHDIAQSMTQAETALIMLNVLLNQAGREDLFLDAEPFSDPVIVSNLATMRNLLPGKQRRMEVEDFLVQTAFEGHPDLASNAVQLRLQNLRLSKSKAQYWPEIGFRASFDMVDSLATRPGFAPHKTSWSMGVEIQLPLFLGGSRAHENRSIRNNISALEYRRDHRRVEIMGAVRTASANFFSWTHRLPAVAQASQYAEDYRYRMIEEYETGRVNQTVLLTALRESRDRSLQMASSRLAFMHSGALLGHVMGISIDESGQIPASNIVARLVAELANR